MGVLMYSDVPLYGLGSWCLYMCLLEVPCMVPHMASAYMSGLIEGWVCSFTSAYTWDCKKT